MKITLVLTFAIFFGCTQSQNKYGIHPASLAEYRTSIKTLPESELVNLENVIPGIVLDIRYATPNNFTGAKVYHLARAYARKPVAEALKKAQADFHQLGYGIKIYDAYRPYSATVKFFEIMKGDTTYVASPYKGSKHNRGCALDMTLIDLTTNEELKMPTPYDSPVKESWPSAPVDDPIIRKNRWTLISVMERNGFRVYEAEWWHFDFIGWEKFAVMDVDFEALEKK